MELFDTHCHIDVQEFEHDRDEVLTRCQAKGIKHILVPAIERKGWGNLISLCDNRSSGAYPALYPALGLHPVFIEQHQDDDIKQLEHYVASHNLIAIGEIGLDFYIKDLDTQRQLTIFESQLVVARDANLPVVLHVRKAHDQVLSLLKKYKLKGGFAHAFNGSLQQAQQYIDLGFKLGFGGTLTYERSSKIRKLAKEIDLGSIVLETDAPDMVVESHRGERNSPEYLTDCLSVLAEIKAVSIDDIAKQTTQNAKSILNIS
ncbi:MAG: TatD family hydrolase [Gammaproteobacteria bacterium]|nr:TatD family hydrolase [Gammaproteobacteria bacterium]